MIYRHIKITIHIIQAIVFSVLLFMGFFVVNASSTGVIVGKVTDKANHEPLAGVNVQVLGTLQGASTDQNGEFLIENVPPGVYSLRVSMIGYRVETVSDVTVRSNQQTNVSIKLESTFIEFDPIVVSAGKREQRLEESPVSLSVVTSKEIERRNPTNIIEALETTPGIHFIGNQINIRGSTGYTFGAGNKVLLLLDGVPVYASDTGEFNWDMLPPLEIEQIEVLKGAGSTLWGSSALGGVVNVLTKDPTPEGKLLFSFTGGKYDAPFYKEWYWTDHDRLFYNREDISYSQRFGPLGLRVSAGRFESTGYHEVGDFRKYNLTGKFDYRFKGGINWTGYAAYSHIYRGYFIQWKSQNDPYEVDESNLDNYAQTNELTLYSTLIVPFSSQFALKARVSMVRTLMGNQFGKSADFNPAYGKGLEFQVDWLPHPAHIITGGIQYQHDAGSTKYFGDHKGYSIGPYIQDEWKLQENLRITAGLRYDRYQLIDGLKEDLFSPRLGINWQPWTTTSIRASAGSGFRAATIVERFLELSIMNFNIVANPDLKAESAWAYEIGVRQYLSENWNIDVALFDNEYWDMIEAHLDLIRGQIQFRNIERARIRGIEATTNLSVPIRVLGINMKPSCQASITAMDHQDLKYNEPLVYRPNVLGTIKSSLQIGLGRLQIDYRYAGKIHEVKIYPINDRVPMKFVDVRASYDFSHFTLQLGVENLFNYNYAPMESNLMPPRTFTAGLKSEIF